MARRPLGQVQGAKGWSMWTTRAPVTKLASAKRFFRRRVLAPPRLRGVVPGRVWCISGWPWCLPRNVSGCWWKKVVVHQPVALETRGYAPARGAGCIGERPSGRRGLHRIWCSPNVMTHVKSS